jgi:hypothetical protein
LGFLFVAVLGVLSFGDFFVDARCCRRFASGAKSRREAGADNQRDEAGQLSFNDPRRWRRKSGRTCSLRYESTPSSRSRHPDR